MCKHWWSPNKARPDTWQSPGSLVTLLSPSPAWYSSLFFYSGTSPLWPHDKGPVDHNLDLKVPPLSQAAQLALNSRPGVLGCRI